MNSIAHFAKVSILYLKTYILPDTNRSSFYFLCIYLGSLLGSCNMLSQTTPPRILTRFSKMFLSVAALHNNSRASCPGLVEKITMKSHISLVITKSIMAVMIRRCAQYLTICYNVTLLVTLKHQVVMNATMVLLHKSGRSMGLTCWYGLFRRDLQIRSWDLYWIKLYTGHCRTSEVLATKLYI